MKRFFVLCCATREVGELVFERIVRAYPPGKVGHLSFQARLPVDSAECRAVLQILEEAGCRPAEHGEEFGPGLFECRPAYDYEQGDLDRADYFICEPGAFIETEYGRSSDGQIQLQPDGVAAGPAMAGVSANGLKIVVSSTLRRELEAANFVGLAFRSTRVVKGESAAGLQVISWDELGVAPYWEITASVTLPPLHPRSRLRDNKNRPVTSDWSKGVWLLEGDFPVGELHYRRKDIRSVEPVDFALTLEQFGGYPNEYTRRLVVSRRVHGFVNNRKLPVNWWLPVYVDDE